MCDKAFFLNNKMYYCLISLFCLKIYKARQRRSEAHRAYKNLFRGMLGGYQQQHAAGEPAPAGHAWFSALTETDAV